MSLHISTLNDNTVFSKYEVPHELTDPVASKITELTCQGGIVCLRNKPVELVVQKLLRRTFSRGLKQGLETCFRTIFRWMTHDNFIQYNFRVLVDHFPGRVGVVNQIHIYCDACSQVEAPHKGLVLWYICPKFTFGHLHRMLLGETNENEKVPIIVLPSAVRMKKERQA